MKGYKSVFVWIAFAAGIVSLLMLISDIQLEIAVYGYILNGLFFSLRGFAVILYIMSSLIALANYNIAPCIIYTGGFIIATITGGIFSDMFGLVGMIVLWCGFPSALRLSRQNRSQFQSLSDKAIDNIAHALLALSEKEANIEISNMPVSERDRHKVLIRYRELAD